MYRLHQFLLYIAQVCAFLLIFHCPALCRAAISSDRGGLHSITLSHGISDLLVNKIYKDSEGFVWFGTESSFDRFDGNQIIRFPIPADNRLSKRVLSIIEFRNKIYVGTNQGLFIYDRKQESLAPFDKEGLDGRINEMAVFKDKLLIATNQGLYVYNPLSDDLTHKLLVNDYLSKENDLLGISVEDDNTVWILTADNIWSSLLTDDAFRSFHIPLSSQATTFILINDIIYIGTDGGGIIPFDTDNSLFLPSIKIGNGIITSLSVTPENDLLVATDGDGVFVYSTDENKIISHISTASSEGMKLRTNSVYSALKDPDGIYWFGYYQGGVDYSPLITKSVSLYRHDNFPELPEENVRALFMDDGHTLIGTHDGLYYINETTGNSYKYKEPQIDSNLIFTITEWNGNYYFGTYHGGMYMLRPSDGVLKKFGPKETHNEVIFKIIEGPDGNLWVGVSNGVYRFDKNNPRDYEFFSSSNSRLPVGNVYEIFFDSLGRGWICTENGIAIWNGTHIQTDGFPPGFIEKLKIRSIFEDSDHNLIFAPDRGDYWIADLSLKNFSSLNQSASGQFGQATSIIEDNDGFIWVGTDKGLVRFDKKDTYNHSIINHVEGLINPVYTLATPYKDKNGDLYFGSTTGLHKIDYDLFQQELMKDNSYSLLITQLESNGKTLAGRLKNINGEYEINLDDRENDLVINVSDLQFKYKDYFFLEYMINEIDPDWKWTEGGIPITYHDLQPGKYTLRIRESGHPDSEIRLKINKRDKFAWWWWAGAFLLTLFIISSVFYIKHKKELKNLKNLSNGSKLNNDIINVSSHNIETDEENKTPYKTTRLSDEECKRILKKLDSVMKSEKPYINPDLKIKDLAGMIDTSAHSLSFVFNQFLDRSYYDYLNEYRVNEFKDFVKNTDTSKYTLSTLAEKCGFSSRASFFRHFKNFTGMTPAEYLKKIDK